MCSAARPDPASAAWSHAPEGEPGEAAEKAAGRPAAGVPKRPVPGGAGARGRRSGLGVGPPAARASVHQFVNPSFLPYAPPGSAAAQPSLLQTAVVKRCRSRAPAPSPANRRASPRRLRTPPSGAARQVPARKGEQAGRAQAWRGGESPAMTRSSPALQRSTGPGGRARGGDCVRDCSRDANPLRAVTMRPEIARRGLSPPNPESSAH